jgi:signal transduction histidine kinase
VVVALLAGLVAAFSYVVLHFQAASRHQSESQFKEEVSLTSEFTGGLLGSSAASSGPLAAKTYGGATIDPRTVKTAGGIAYLVILNSHGARLAASPGTPAGAASASSKQVRLALAGQSSFSDLIPAPKARNDLLEWALPFSTQYGRRVEVEGLPASSLAAIFDSLLTQTQKAGKGAALILDSQNRVIGTSTTKLGIGEHLISKGLTDAISQRPSGAYSYGGVHRYFATVPIAGTTWTALMTTTTNQLYSPFSGSKAWILYLMVAGFALACAASSLFFRRALVVSSALQSSNDELNRVNATLEDRVAERTASAEDRARELARSNQELELFSSVASHDLQEPLRKVRMFGDRLRDRLGDAITEEARDDLERMRNAAERMQGLINDLLEFSRINYRASPFEEVDLAEVAAGVLSDLEARIAELDATVDVGQLPVVHADPMQMRQLLQNLISNALKFHRDGVVPVVRVRAEAIPAVEARFAAEAGASERYMLTVEDNGIGFDEQYAERIFGPFERLHGRAAYEGTGIGLSIARKIVWRHGGHISATSVPGEGATFTITIPLVPNSEDRND